MLLKVSVIDDMIELVTNEGKGGWKVEEVRPSKVICDEDYR